MPMSKSINGRDVDVNAGGARVRFQEAPGEVHEVVLVPLRRAPARALELEDPQMAVARELLHGEAGGDAGVDQHAPAVRLRGPLARLARALASPRETLTPVPLTRSEEHTSELQSRENLVC